MATLLFYFFVAFLLPLIIGCLIALAFWGFYSRFKRWRLKRKYLLNKNTEEFKEMTLDGGKLEASEKEVKENDRRRNQKFREFDKLRDIATSQRHSVSQGGIKSKGQDTGILQPERYNVGGINLSNTPDKQHSQNKPEHRNTGKRIRLDE